MVSPAKTLGVIRVDNLNGEDPTGGTIVTLRAINQTQTIATRPAYDDVTGVGTPNGAAYVNSLGNVH